MYGLIFTVLAGSLSVLSYCQQNNSMPIVQNPGVAWPTPSPSGYLKSDPALPSPSPSLANQGTLREDPSQPAHVTITGYLVDNYFADVGHFGMLEGKVGELYSNEQIDPMERIKSRSRATLLAPRSIRSGYSIVYYGPMSPEVTNSPRFAPSFAGGTLRLDKVGNGLAKTILTFSKKSAGVRVEATGQEVNNRFKVSSMKEVEQ